MNATKQLEDAVFFTALNLSDLEQRKLFLDLELWSGVVRDGWPPERHRCGIGAGLGFVGQILGSAPPLGSSLPALGAAVL